MPLVLVVDDIPALAEQYAYDLRRVGDFETLVAPGGKEALDLMLSEPVDCVVLDLEMPRVDGFDVLRAMKKDGIAIPVVVYTGTGNFDRCVQAIKLGAYGFVDKAESMPKVVTEIENALERHRLEREVDTLKSELRTESSLIGTSAPMTILKKEIARLAAIPSAVLIVGESGTGKELVARELHRLGPGDRKPFVAVNCAALPDNLVESELFGHERGAFTGADRTHKGAFEQAAGGTIFLDEIAELPQPAQAKLLRVLEQYEMTRVGGERKIEVTARVVAATHRDLDQDVETGSFRKDLLYRLNVHILNVPPLRDRRSDIPELGKHLVALVCRRFGMPARTLSPNTLDALMAYDWKRNNVRELRNIVERMIIASDGDTIGVDSVPAEIRGGGGEPRGDPRTFKELKSESERQIVVSALERNDWHISNTAKDLGLADHSSLLKIMRRLSLSVDTKSR